jgi:hypothetical protein
MRRIVIVLAASALVLGLFVIGPSVVMGTGGGKDCSPGYFKNHTEEWFGYDCCEPLGLTDEECLEELKAKGPGSEIRRRAAAAALNACTGCKERD